MTASRTLSLASALLFAACDTTPPEPEVAPLEGAEAAVVVAEVFCRSANTIWQDCAVDGAVARFQGHEVSFGVTPVSFIALPGKTIGMGDQAQDIPGELQVGLDYSLSLDGRVLITGVVNHAASDMDLDIARTKVMDEAAQRFMVGHGLGVIDALINTPS